MVLILFVISGVSASAQVGLNVDVEAKVRAFFYDTSVMIEIARCESKFRQYTDFGNPLYGGAGGQMVGVFQVNAPVHKAYARSIGFDIETLEGNLGYAKHLYQKEGTRPWLSSFPCWGSSSNAEVSSSGPTAAATTDTSASGITVKLSFGMVHPQVLTLQKLLNEKGFTVAPDGPGSPGQETTMFGSLTRAAVKKFQCARIQVCDGDEHTSGYGFVGPRTRAALANAAPQSAPAATPQATTTVAATTSATVSGGSGGSYSPAQQAQVDALNTQISELQQFLQMYQTGEQQP